MKIAFTGTRRGLSDKQRVELANLLAANSHQITDCAHGNCIGADTEFGSLVAAILPFVVRLHVFPSTDRRTQAMIPQGAYYVASPDAPLDRNQSIVECGRDLLVACPLQLTEQRRGGTWDAYYKAKAAGVPVKVLWRY